MSSTASLLDLPDDIILLVLCDLSAFDVVSCSFVCSRLQRVCLDHTLWTKADFIKNGRELSTSQAEIALGFLCARTKSLYIRAISRPEQLFSKRLLRKVIRTCPELRTLVLENWNLELTVQDFPRKLWRLSISGSKPAEVQDEKPERRKRKYPNWFTPGLQQQQEQQQKRSYFFGIFLAIPRLQSLDLSHCQWLDNHSLLALSKCQHLRELSINGCTKMGGCVAYSALAAGMGFSALERLDVRDTNMEDIDLKNFLSKATIEQLFVGCSMGPPEPRLELTDKELADWDSKQQWPKEQETEMDFPAENPVEESSDDEDSSSRWSVFNYDSGDSEELGPTPRKMFCKDDVSAADSINNPSCSKSHSEKLSPSKSAAISANSVSTEAYSAASNGLDFDAPGPSCSSRSAPLKSLGRPVNDSLSSSNASSSKQNAPDDDFESPSKDEDAQPEKTRQIVAILETIRRVDQDANRPLEGGITLQIRASSSDIEGMSRRNRNIENPVHEGLPRGVVLQLISPRHDPRLIRPLHDPNNPAEQGNPNVPEMVPQAGPSRNDADETPRNFAPNARDRGVARTRTHQLAMSLKGKVWSPWQQFNEDTVEPRRIRVGRESTADGEDFEEYLEEDGRNVIVLNCMNEGIHRTTHVYTKLDFPKVSKKAKPGAYVTDDLVRYPVQCKKLQVLTLAGCKKVTDTFLTFLVRHDLNCLRLLDVRETSVTEKGVLNLQAYMGNNLTVHY